MYTYKLPNGISINAERLTDDVLVSGDFPQTYLDIETGALIEIPTRESLGVWVQEVGDARRHFLVERFTETEKISLAKDFVRNIMPMDSSKAKQTKALKLLQTSSLSAFEDFLESETDGWIHGWDQYLADEAWEYVHDWLTNNPHVKIEAIFEGCGDCVLCDSLKDGAQSTVPDLLKAFDTERVMQSVRSQLAQRSNTEVRHKTDPAYTDQAFVFKVTLKYSQPAIWRRVIIPANATFYELHCVIQSSMGWTDCHLHNFRVSLQSSGKNSSRPRAELTHVITLPSNDLEAYEDDPKDIDERYEVLSNWFGTKVQQCIYTYDFGDNWEHTS
jgi:hypothetical protein